MPEAPETKIIAESLSLLVGSTINKITLTDKAKVKNFDLLLLPLTITKIYSYGKKLIFKLNNQNYIVFSLGMTGTLTFNKNNYSHIHFKLDRYDLYFNDIRRFGNVEVFNKKEKKEYINKLGIDILSRVLANNITSDEWLRLFEKHGNKKIYDVLMDQHVIAGLGNYLTNDSLCLAAIHPLRLIKTITKDEMIKLLQSISNILLKSYHAKGLTIKNYFTPNNEKGSYQPLIYGHKTAAKLKYKGRTLFYDPTTQTTKID